MIEAAGPFPRGERIRHSREFRDLSRRGERRAGRSFVFLLTSGATPGATRLGVTVSRRVGNAVVRNRVKRRIREWFRRVGRETLAGSDLVVIARPGAGELDSAESERELTALAAGVAPGARR